MKTFLNFEEMIATAFKVNENGEMCSWPQFACQKRFIPSVENNEKKYNVINHVITFIFEGHQYVIPFTYGIIDLLIENSFSVNTDLAVPFAHLEYSIDRRNEWRRLQLLLE